MSFRFPKKCTSMLKYKDRSTFFVIGDGDWEIICNGPVVNLTGTLLASQDLYVTRCILKIDLCLEIWGRIR